MEELTTKICSKCREEKPVSDFYKVKATKTGLDSRCKKCRDIGTNEWRKKNKEHIAMVKKEWYRKNRQKSIDYAKKWHSENKERVAISVKKSTAKHMDKAVIRTTRYRKKNLEKYAGYAQARKARKKELKATFTTDQWEIAKNFFDNKCAYCGKKRKLQQDHFIPIVKGGNYSKENVIPACGSCNTKKHTKDFEEWYPTHEYYDKAREAKILLYLEKVL